MGLLARVLAGQRPPSALPLDTAVVEERLPPADLFDELDP